MKYILLLVLVFSNLISFSQIGDTVKNQSNKTSGRVSFITTVDIANATKDGIYLNGYLVNIDFEEAKKLNGRRVRITGKVTTVKGLKSLPGNEIRQGREEDSRYIKSPKIKIIKN